MSRELGEKLKAKKERFDTLITGENINSLPLPSSDKQLQQGDKLDYQTHTEYFRYFKLNAEGMTICGRVLKNSDESKPTDAEWISPEEFIRITQGEAELSRIKGHLGNISKAIWLRELKAIREMKKIESKLKS